MKLLDIYLLRRYLTSLLLSVVGLWLISVIVDLIERIDTFIDFNATPSQILSYYFFHSPYWIILTLPIATLLGTLFALGNFARNLEITAMKAAGISLYRILAPVFVCALLFSSLAFLFTDRVVPEATFRYNRILDHIRSHNHGDGSRKQVLLQDADNQFIFVRSYDAGNQRGHEVNWEWRPPNAVGQRLVARRMEWRQDRWLAIGGRLYHFDNERPHSTAFDTLALDRLTLRPADFARQRKKPEEMDYGELNTYIERAQANGEDAARHLVDLHLKISFPFTCFIMVLLGAPLAANARRAGFANSFGIGIFICFAFYSCVKAGQALGWNKLADPFLAAWLGNIIFVLLSLVLLWRAHK